MSRESGFTLIELSIVLVIIGMIAGGILLGTELIRAAELRTVISESDQMKAAINVYRMKYRCLPGDCPFATQYFGVDPNGCPNGGASTGTCDGNNNGKIGAINSVDVDRCEGYHLWVQLSAAGLVKGKYITPTGADCYTSLIGTGTTHAPGASVGNGALWTMISTGRVITDVSSAPMWVSAELYTGMYDNFLALGAPGSQNRTAIKPVLRPQEAHSIETKIDDGKPDLGKVRNIRQGAVNFPDSATCADNPTPGLANYNLGATGLVCPLIILTGI